MENGTHAIEVEDVLAGITATLAPCATGTNRTTAVVLLRRQKTAAMLEFVHLLPCKTQPCIFRRRVIVGSVIAALLVVHTQRLAQSLRQEVAAENRARVGDNKTKAMLVVI